MACEEPRRAYQRSDGGALRFSLPNPNESAHTWRGIQIPCGTCILCRNEQARQQAIRIAHEATLWPTSSFLTMSYADEHLPRYNSLNYDHLEKFWKRLRKHLGELRYYAVGEYGDISLRPHYHACLFGHDFTENSVILTETPHRTWVNEKLTRMWGYGRVVIGQLNYQTARYTASYVTKKLRAKQRYVRVDEATGELIELEQPAARMSRNLGKEWWTQWGHQVADHDYVIINANKHKPPKAYDRWLGEVNENKLKAIKQARQQHAQHLTPEQTRARARNARAHAKAKSKKV